VRQAVEPVDCPECGAAGSIYEDFCEVCYADVDGELACPRMMLHPSVPLRFSDVIEELRAIAELAPGFGDLAGHRVVTACRRAESLLCVLRRQFMHDVVVGEGPPSNG
jgi:hypothetical protein